MSIWSGNIQEKHLIINAKAGFVISLYMIYYVLNKVFDLSLDSLPSWIEIPLFLLLIYWVVKGGSTIDLQPSFIFSYKDEYIKELYQRSMTWGGNTAMFTALLFGFADFLVAQHFTVTETGKSIFALAWFVQSTTVLWWLYRDAKAERAINAEQEG